MTIYTKTGDQGMTALASGERVSKTDLRVEAYGTLDELNTAIGVLRCWLESAQGQCVLSKNVCPWLMAIQHDVFNMGSDLATSFASKRHSVMPVGNREVAVLEKWIDTCQNATSQLRSFVLPGSHMANAYAHMARTICRRAERRVVALIQQEGESNVNINVRVYLNRLSDFFFALSRFLDTAFPQVKEVIWNKEGGVAS